MSLFTPSWNYCVNFFDANHPGSAYQVAVTDIKTSLRAPVLQFISDKTVKEGQQVSFIVTASDPDGAERPAALYYVDTTIIAPITS